MVASCGTVGIILWAGDRSQGTLLCGGRLVCLVCARLAHAEAACLVHECRVNFVDSVRVLFEDVFFLVLPRYHSGVRLPSRCADPFFPLASVRPKAADSHAESAFERFLAVEASVVFDGT